MPVLRFLQYYVYGETNHIRTVILIKKSKCQTHGGLQQYRLLCVGCWSYFYIGCPKKSFELIDSLHERNEPKGSAAFGNVVAMEQTVHGETSVIIMICFFITTLKANFLLRHLILK